MKQYEKTKLTNNGYRGKKLRQKIKKIFFKHLGLKS